MSAESLSAVSAEPGAGDQASRLRDLVRSLRGGVPPQPGPPPQPGARPSRLDDAPDALGAEPACPCPVITIASGKGGVGKTCVAVGIASALAESGRRVTLLDADPGMANADVLCGVSPRRRLDLARARVEQVRALAMDLEWGFRLVPGAVGEQGSAGSGQHVDDRAPRAAHALAGAGEGSDIAIVDVGGGLGRSVTEFVRRSDLTIIVTTPEPTAIADAYALLKTVVHRSVREGEPSACARPALVVNQASDESEAGATHARIRRVAERFLGIGMNCAGWVARDRSVPDAVRRRRPVLFDAPRSLASQGLRDIALWTADRLNIGGDGSTGTSSRRSRCPGGRFARS